MHDRLADEQAIERIPVDGRKPRGVQRGFFIDGQRREAALTGNIARAWDASAAAAGALMLVARARTEIQELFRFPQLPQ